MRTTLSSVAILLVLSHGFEGRVEARQGPDEAAAAIHRAGTFQGSDSCLSCHCQPTISDRDRGTLDWCLMTEYATWRTVDKHSMAYAVLEGPRGQRMGELLGVDVTKAEAGCLSCHSLNVPGQRLSPEVRLQDGVSCEVCHGPSERWDTPHRSPEWRAKPPSEKEELGMADLRNPERHSSLCLSCHLGDAKLGRIVSHPMYAAGHPPLPSVEVAQFARNIPKHWRQKDAVGWWDDAPEEVREAYGIGHEKGYQTELLITGNIVALRESMTLLAERSAVADVSRETIHSWPELALNREVQERAAAGGDDALRGELIARWPEVAMSHADCLACHHGLREPSWRQRRESSAPPGRPSLRLFPTALVEASLAAYGEVQDREDFERLLRRLTDSFTSRPFGRPMEVGDAADAMAHWAGRFYEDRIRPHEFARDANRELLRQILLIGTRNLCDYDTARQIAAALRTIHQEASPSTPGDGPTADALARLSAEWDELLNLDRYPRSEERDRLSLEILRVLSGDPTLDGIASWTPLALGEPRDSEAYWAASQRNPILRAFREAVAPARLRDAYMSDQFKLRLQEINNAGLRIALDRASRYDPYRFRSQVQEFERIVGGEWTSSP